MASKKRTPPAPATGAFHRGIDRDRTDRAQLESALVEEIKAQTERLKRSPPPGASDARTIRILRADVRIIEAIVQAQQERLGLLEEAVSSLKRPPGGRPRP